MWLLSDLSVLFLARIWWIWRLRNILPYGDYYNGDRWLIHQIHILAQDPAIRLGREKIYLARIWHR
ncbi:hypothetical protein NC652_009689 [Populus alba x Populus x berolinensis]|nr:hypothetical protein NC652_009689 [Populus alba x Populus x berolinensis]